MDRKSKKKKKKRQEEKPDIEGGGSKQLGDEGSSEEPDKDFRFKRLKERCVRYLVICPIPV